MTDLEYKKQKKRVGDFLTKWQSCMGLRWWDIQVIWDRSYASKAATGATTDMNGWKYRTATITFYLPKIAEEDEDSEIEKLVIHELCHVLMSPISVNMEDLDSDYQVQINEFTTTLVAEAFWWTQTAVKEEGEKHGPKHANASRKSK